MGNKKSFFFFVFGGENRGRETGELAMAMAMASSPPPPTSASASASHSLLLLALAALGALSLLKLLRRSACWLWRHFLRPGKSLARYGSWALVTGCTDGIGRSIATELARRGLNLLLVARSREKAERLAAEIASLHGGVQVQVVLLDLAAAEAELEAGLSRVEEAVAGLDLGILVNNAGVSYPYARFFHEVDPDLALHLLRINVHAMVRMVQIVLPGMLKRRRGAILNLGSGSASVLPSDPLYTLYTATKGYAIVDQYVCMYVWKC
jgi:17beta-estradiol 17-dehydrogenase / very-long-chain 3-oxoacyl-CoA reductase